MRAASETVVYPRTFDVAGLPPAADTDAEPGDGSESSTLHRGHGGEFWGVREYRPGDPARLVAWKRSARGLPSGKLAVIELARETHPPFVLAMDLDAAAPPEAREMVVSAGASLLLYALGEGREVNADAGPDNRTLPRGQNPRHRPHLVRRPADLQATRPREPRAWRYAHPPENTRTPKRGPSCSYPATSSRVRTLDVAGTRA